VADGPHLLTYDFPLRPDLLVRLTLPVGLTRHEASRVTRFVSALVMPGDDVVEACVHHEDCDGECAGGCNG
jgi:hypothetical protein